MRCRICETRTAEEGQNCCIECEVIDDYLASAPADSTPAAGRVEEPVTVQGCCDCQKRAAVFEGRCLQCDRAYRDGPAETTTAEEETMVRTLNAGKMCDMDGCDAAAVCKGKCIRHYQRAQRAAKNGSAAATPADHVREVRKMVAPVAAVERKAVAAKAAGEPDSITLLRDEARRQRDGAVQAAEEKYAKTLEAIDIVAELTR